MSAERADPPPAPRRAEALGGVGDEQHAAVLAHDRLDRVVVGGLRRRDRRGSTAGRAQPERVAVSIAPSRLSGSRLKVSGNTSTNTGAAPGSTDLGGGGEGEAGTTTASPPRRRGQEREQQRVGAARARHRVTRAANLGQSPSSSATSGPRMKAPWSMTLAIASSSRSPAAVAGRRDRRRPMSASGLAESAAHERRSSGRSRVEVARPPSRCVGRGRHRLPRAPDARPRRTHRRCRGRTRSWRWRRSWRRGRRAWPELVPAVDLGPGVRTLVNTQPGRRRRRPRASTPS